MRKRREQSGRHFISAQEYGGSFPGPAEGTSKRELALEDLWLIADHASKPGPAMTFAEMNRAKVRP